MHNFLLVVLSSALIIVGASTTKVFNDNSHLTFQEYLKVYPSKKYNTIGDLNKREQIFEASRAAVIKQNDNEYINVSRNEEKIAELKREFPEVKSYVGNIEDKGLLLRVFKNVKPDVVIHAAAMKHIDLMELNPVTGCHINVMGS